MSCGGWGERRSEASGSPPRTSPCWRIPRLGRDRLSPDLLRRARQVREYPNRESPARWIAQEALVNVRKHSGAQHVVVRLGSGKDEWKLVVDDDGHGFDFERRLCQAELDAALAFSGAA